MKSFLFGCLLICHSSCQILYEPVFDDFENELVVGVSCDAFAPERAQGIAQTWATRFRTVLFFVDSTVSNSSALRKAIQPFELITIDRAPGDHIVRTERETTTRKRTLKGYSLSIFHYLFTARPDSQWYFHADDDTFVVPINLLMLLRQHDSTARVYLGAISFARGAGEAGTARTATMLFAIGGSGIVVSRGLLSLAAPNFINCSATYVVDTTTSDSHLARCLLMGMADPGLSARAAAHLRAGESRKASLEYETSFSQLHGGIHQPGMLWAGVRHVLAQGQRYDTNGRSAFKDTLVITAHPMCQSEMLATWRAIEIAIRDGNPITWGIVQRNWRWQNWSQVEKLHRLQNISFCAVEIPTETTPLSFHQHSSLRFQTSVIGHALVGLPQSVSRLSRVSAPGSKPACLKGRFTFKASPVRYVMHCLRQCAMALFIFAGIADGSVCFCGNRTEQDRLQLIESSHCNRGCELQPEFPCGGHGVMSSYSVNIPR